MEKWTKLYCSDYYEVSDMGNVRSIERIVPHARYGKMKQKRNNEYPPAVKWWKKYINKQIQKFKHYVYT